MENGKDELASAEDVFAHRCRGIATEIRELRKAFDARVKQVFDDNVKFIFERFPWIKTITWTGCTPSFCDGGPCDFYSSHGESVINGRDDDFDGMSPISYGDYDGDYDDEADDEADDVEAETVDDKEEEQDLNDYSGARSVVNVFLRSFTEEDMQMLFGDGVRVVLRPKGIEVVEEECED